MIRSLLPLAALPLVAAAPVSVDAMKHARRVLLVAAPSRDDPQLLAQRRALAGWRAGGAARDVSVVELVGDRVSGASDSAATLRALWRLPADRFQAVLIGKDGNEAARERQPFAADALERIIDAMPMRRAGQR